jgi:Domain of unknown function (DUF1707)
MCHARHHRQRSARRSVEDALRQDPELRASDAERESTVTLLREHGAAGRIDVEELELRVGAAYAARTRGDLPRASAAVARPTNQQVRRHHDHARQAWTTFAYVSALLVAIWALSGAGYFWPAWVIVWWGLALVIGSASRPLRPRWGRAALRPPR